MASKRYDLLFVLEYSFLLLIFSLGFMQPNIEVSGLSLPVTDLLFVIVSAIWLVALIRRKSQLHFDKSYLFFGLYAAGLLLSVVFSQESRSSLIKYLGELYLIGLGVMTFNIVRTAEMIKKVTFVWLAASTVTALAGTITVCCFYLGVTNFITDFAMHHYGSLPPGNYPRIQGTFLYPSLLCNYLTVSLMLLFTARRLGWIGRFLFILLLVVFGVTIAFTVTPGIGGVLLALGLWFWLGFSESNQPLLSKGALTAGILSAFGFLAVASFPLIGGFIPQRPLTWQSAFQTFLAHPVFGIGLGLPVAEIYFLAPGGETSLLTDAHNVVISVAAQSGIIGVIPLVLICILVVRRTIPFNFGSDKSTLQCCLGIAFISAFLYQGIVGSFEDARHLWVLIGLILALGAIDDLRSGRQ